jgi:hypothetical protein
MTISRFAFALALLAATLSPAAASAQQPDSAMIMQKWQEYMTPGPAHQRLAQDAGEWTWTSTFWATPDAPPEKSSGTMSARTIMGGRYLVEDWKGTAMNMPFEGHSLSGYDNAKGQHFSTWIDNFGTGVMTSWGSYDEASRTMTMKGSFIDPVTGKEQSARSVMRRIDDGSFIFEMYGPGPDGKEYKSMELHGMRKS